MNLAVALLVWGIGAFLVLLIWTWYLSPLQARELPGAAMAWLAGGETRRRLKAVIAMRRMAEELVYQAENEQLAREAELKAARPRPQRPETVRLIMSDPRGRYGTGLSEQEMAALCDRIVAGQMSVPEARMALRLPEPTRLVAPGEPACDDPSCAGCQALRARRAHEAAR